MAEAIINSKGQITIPRSTRELLGLKPNDKIVFVSSGDQIIMVPVRTTLADLYGSGKHEGPSLDLKKIRRDMQEDIAKKRSQKEK